MRGLVFKITPTMSSFLLRGDCLCLKVGEWIVPLLFTRKRRLATVEQHVLPSAEGATRTMREHRGVRGESPERVWAASPHSKTYPHTKSLLRRNNSSIRDT